MLFYTSAPLMTESSAPNTEPMAKPTQWQTVTNARVIRVKKAAYRNAYFDGVFLIDEVETEKHKGSKDGWSVAVVFCLWFGTRLKTRGIEIKYESESAELIENFTGEVITNLST